MQKIPFEDLPSTNTPIDATNLNTMQNYIEQAVNDKIGLITLLEASSTAPEQCETGDLYYNTDTALIYEATGTDTWNNVGNAPSYEYLYLDKTNKVIYYFNGTALDVFGAAVVDDLTSISTVNPPSIDAVNSAIETIDTELNNKINSLKPKVLWENPNKNVAFLSQTITLSTDDYDYLEIYYYDWNDLNVGYKNVLCQKVWKGDPTQLMMSLNYDNKGYSGTRRLMYQDDTTYLVGSGYTVIDHGQLSVQVQNLWNVPIKIIGYKY